MAADVGFYQRSSFLRRTALQDKRVAINRYRNAARSRVSSKPVTNGLNHNRENTAGRGQGDQQSAHIQRNALGARWRVLIG